MQPELAALAVGRRTIDVEIYRPPGRGPWPAVLLLHELFGLTSHVRADARALAREGYLVFAPDLFTGGGRSYCMKIFFSRDGLANRGNTEAVREVHALLDRMKAHPDSNGKLGMIGMCLTGGFVLQMARRDDLAAPVVFHHSLGLRGSGIPEEEARDIDTVVQGHFAVNDRVCPRGRVEALARQLGDKLEVNLYEGAGHGLRSAFRHTPAGEESWQRTLAFFREHLR